MAVKTVSYMCWVVGQATLKAPDAAKKTGNLRNKQHNDSAAKAKHN